MDLCPSPQRLQQFLVDQLPADEALALEAHIETCQPCQQALEQMVAVAQPPTIDQGEPPTGGGRRTDDAAFLQRLAAAPLRRTTAGARAKGEMAANDPSTTVLQAYPPARSARPELVLVSQQMRSAQEVQTLLRKRLRFIMLFVLAGLVLNTATTLPLLWNLGFFPFYLLLVMTSVGVAVLLWSQRSLSFRLLRWIESVVFAGLVLVLTWMSVRYISEGGLERAARDDTPGVIVLARAIGLSWFGVLVIYGILIPNTWRRCTVVVGLATIWGLGVTIVSGLRQPSVEFRLLVPFLVQMAAILAAAAALAIYGSHRIEVLRQKVEQARKLGQYQLKQRLGSGGMGEVYLAEHVLLRRPCALKLIRPERAGDSDSLRRFEREVQVTATLTHPNTVEIFDYGHSTDGTFYYVMEYLPGPNLEELVGQAGPLPPARAVHLLRQVCGSLAEAHAAGLIHRDIKPSNIIACERGGRPDVAKLLDFGLARGGPVNDAAHLTQEGIIAGTPAYMSPEQAGGGDLDQRSDIYSLGGLAYFLLTGQPPFVRPTVVQTLAAHLGEAVAPPSSLRPDLPGGLEAIVLRCLEKDPSRRFPTALALEQALAECGADK
jgi:serine/threonine-protein kinase